MATNAFDSSDSVRSGRPLKHVKTVLLDKPLKLELGGELSSVTVAYEMYGRLADDGSNAILICHAISGDSHVAMHDPNDDPGWWDIAVGPGKIIDTDKYCVICPNILGGCRGTTGPGSINPATGKPWGADFPTITMGDIVEVQWRLLEQLGIHRLRAVIGGSMGGHQAICWSRRHPGFMKGVVALATSPRLTSQALAFDIVGRNAILTDPDYRDGEYYSDGPKPDTGLAIARMLGHITYLSFEAMEEKFELDRLQPKNVPTEFEKRFSVGSYLAYQGNKFTERFDANSYLRLTMAMDLFDLGGSPATMAQSLAMTKNRWLVVSFSSDWLFPPAQSQAMVNALIATGKRVSYCNVTSSCGHDAFLLPDDIKIYGELIRVFVENLGDENGRANLKPSSSTTPSQHRPTSIFYSNKLECDILLDIIPPGASVLDLGCGDGGLLAALKERGHPRLIGVELDEQAITACVARGLDVVQSDLNCGLRQFADGEFDFVVLSQTLQAVMDVKSVISEMSRVGRRCLVSFPNFAYWKLRKMLCEGGRVPVTEGLLHYKWYNTPNIRFLSMDDFEEFCRECGLVIHRRLALDTESDREIIDNPNYNADMAIYVISR